MAFSLLDEKPFFTSYPRHSVYDLYIVTFDAQKLKRFVEREYEISKVMIVILSKEEGREEVGAPKFDYQLTDMKLHEKPEASF